MPQKRAFLFPGQGSQFVGMGRDLAQQFHSAGEICGKGISKLCFEGPMEALTLTENLQPAITAVSLACLAALAESGVRADVSAGHSLGEYSALVSSGVLSTYDALRLVRKRGELMQREADAYPGTMAAVLGLGCDDVSNVVAAAKADGVLAIANHNTADQIVITGEQEPLGRAVQLVKGKGWKAIPLKVSGAWHCELMRGAVIEFRRFMDDIPFSKPRSAILFNATAQEESSPEKIRDIMANQLVSHVKWFGIMEAMRRDTIDVFIEVGPKKVLSGLLKKITPSAKSFNVEDVATLKAALEAVS